jgi:hypothetical protein
MMIRPQHISTIDLPKHTIFIRYRSCIYKFNDFSEHKINENIRRLLSKSYREHCERIEAHRYKHLYSSIKLKDLERIVNEVINKL